MIPFRPCPPFKEPKMAKKKKAYAEKSREERVTGKVPVGMAEELDKNSREYHAKHGWPKKNG